MEILQNDNYLLDKDFLKELDLTKTKEVFAKIIALDLDENPIEEITGKVTSGSINVDGGSAVRRTCNLSLISEEVNFNDFYWGLNTKFKLAIGLKNDIRKDYPDIIWFKQGVYFITSFSCSQSTNSYTISINGKDKMCMLNGELGGVLPASTDFGVVSIYNEETEENEEKELLVYDIIKEAVHFYGKEPYHNISINDLDTYGLHYIKYGNEIPGYLWIQNKVFINEDGEKTTFSKYFKLTLDKEQQCWYEDINGQMIATTIGNIPVYAQLENKLTEVNENKDATVVYFSGEKSNNIYYTIIKVVQGQVIGYDITDFTYPKALEESLKLGAGETITTLLDRIINTFGDYEYFYDLDGRFVFQKKKTFINTSWNNLSVIDNEVFAESSANTSSYSYFFEDSNLITSFSNNPNFSEIKNDYVAWGERIAPDGKTKLPIHGRFAIDNKPMFYHSINVSEDEIQGYDKIKKTQIGQSYFTEEYCNYLSVYYPEFLQQDCSFLLSDLDLKFNRLDETSENIRINIGELLKSYSIDNSNDIMEFDNNEASYSIVLLITELTELISFLDQYPGQLYLKAKSLKQKEKDETMFLKLEAYLEKINSILSLLQDLKNNLQKIQQHQSFQIYQNIKQALKLLEGIIALLVPVDWREIIYQMAKDYYLFGALDSFSNKIKKANKKKSEITNDFYKLENNFLNENLFNNSYYDFSFNKYPSVGKWTEIASTDTQSSFTTNLIALNLNQNLQIQGLNLNALQNFIIHYYSLNAEENDEDNKGYLGRQTIISNSNILVDSICETNNNYLNLNLFEENLLYENDSTNNITEKELNNTIYIRLRFMWKKEDNIFNNNSQLLQIFYNQEEYGNIVNYKSSPFEYYQNGYTEYEQYYLDQQGFWRQLYSYNNEKEYELFNYEQKDIESNNLFNTSLMKNNGYYYNKSWVDNSGIFTTNLIPTKGTDTIYIYGINPEATVYWNWWSNNNSIGGGGSLKITDGSLFGGGITTEKYDYNSISCCKINFDNSISAPGNYFTIGIYKYQILSKEHRQNFQSVYISYTPKFDFSDIPLILNKNQEELFVNGGYKRILNSDLSTMPFEDKKQLKVLIHNEQPQVSELSTYFLSLLDLIPINYINPDTKQVQGNTYYIYNSETNNYQLVNNISQYSKDKLYLKRNNKYYNIIDYFLSKDRADDNTTVNSNWDTLQKQQIKIKEDAEGMLKTLYNELPRTYIQLSEWINNNEKGYYADPSKDTKPNQNIAGILVNTPVCNVLPGISTYGSNLVYSYLTNSNSNCISVETRRGLNNKFSKIVPKIYDNYIKNSDSDDDRQKTYEKLKLQNNNNIFSSIKDNEIVSTLTNNPKKIVELVDKCDAEFVANINILKKVQKDLNEEKVGAIPLIQNLANLVNEKINKYKEKKKKEKDETKQDNIQKKIEYLKTFRENCLYIIKQLLIQEKNIIVDLIQDLRIQRQNIMNELRGLQDQCLKEINKIQNAQQKIDEYSQYILNQEDFDFYVSVIFDKSGDSIIRPLYLFDIDTIGYIDPKIFYAGDPNIKSLYYDDDNSAYKQSILYYTYKSDGTDYEKEKKIINVDGVSKEIETKAISIEDIEYYQPIYQYHQYNKENFENSKAYWNKMIDEEPDKLNYWFDFLDVKSDAGLNKYSIKSIGSRTKVDNNTKAGAIYYKEVPNVLYLSENSQVQSSQMTGYDKILISQAQKENLLIVSQGITIKDQLDTMLYNYGYCQESISLNCVPIYYLEPNTRIYVRDEKTGINGEYIMTKFTIPLSHNGTMSITASKAPQRLR